ncbi:isocitrate/isopropylmalate dehydrogenase family protein [Gordonia sp. zg691]|uniref:isocitrate/isopropylmalate dehydrogenase family protein n=1 Tax=Gordonia jinghuaiqii TaxID=2758710 RepID=UPI0016622768|nr:isocitrate/isopropylmalate family dehydrogenase [Gordonia jinghuaiqii]MBD0860217.1 isocitrate/isopropylmalate dehydrogenase family protein [Gordonia jinghuaiqii]
MPDNARRIGVLVGDGIGAEIVPAAVAVADAAAHAEGIEIDWCELPFGAAAIESHDDPVPPETLSALDDLGLWLVGPHDSASYPAQHSARTPGAVLRTRYGLFANLRPAKAFSGVPAVKPDIDVLIVRENSEGLYADRNMAVGSGEFMPTADVALSVGLVTRAASERIARVAFAAAADRAAPGRPGRVTIVHKANVLRLTTGLFRDVCREVATEFAEIEVTEQHVDAMAALLVRRPADFDVIVTENLFGDILSDLAGELAGSLGIAGSVNCSETQVMAQATHGAAPDIAGRDVANPVAMIASVAMGFRRYGLMTDDAALIAVAGRMESAVADTLATSVATADLGGTASTTRFAAAVAQQVVRTRVEGAAGTSEHT